MANKETLSWTQKIRAMATAQGAQNTRNSIFEDPYVRSARAEYQRKLGSLDQRTYRAETAVEIAEATIRRRQQELWAEDNPREFSEREDIRERKLHAEAVERQRQHFEAEEKVVRDVDRNRIWRTEERPKLARERAAFERRMDEEQLPYIKQPPLPLDAPDYFMPAAAKPHVGYRTQAVDGNFNPLEAPTGVDEFGRPSRTLPNPLTQGARSPGEHPEVAIRREHDRQMAERAKEKKG